MNWAAKIQHSFPALSRRRKAGGDAAQTAPDAMAGAAVAMPDEFLAPIEEPVAKEPAKRSSRRLAGILMVGALLSKMLGFVREVLMAHVLGASLIADGFRGAIAAVIIPLAFLQSESVPAIMIPMHRDAQAKGNAPQRLAALTIAVTLAAVVLMLAIQALGQWWVRAVVGGFVPEGQAVTLEFVRIMALGMPASAMLNCLAAGEIAMGRSRLTNIRATLLNISILGGIGILVLTGYVSALAWAFTFGFNALAVWGLWCLSREGHLTLAGVTPAMVMASGWEFLRRLRPLLALPTAEQGQVWIERTLASRLTTGAVASLDYARTLTDSALLLIGQPVGLAVLSSYPPKDERAQIDSIVRAVLAVGLPASAFLFVFAPDVVRLIFFRGAFTEEGVLMTSQALRGIAVGLWASTLGWILLRLLNGAGRNVVAAVILVAAYAVNIAVNLLTSGFQGESGMGLFLLGLGEAARAGVLLGGVALALQCVGRVFVLILVGLIPAAVMLAVGFQIQHVVPGTLERLLAGGVACTVCVLLAVAALMPTAYRTGFAYLRRSASRTRET